MRSMPTRETRTHASMTIPLSRTRSRTSMRLVPPAARSTGISLLCLRQPSRSGPPPGQRHKPSLQRADLFLQLLVLRRERVLAWRQVMIELPPVQPDLLGLIDRTDQEADSNREQLHFGERHLDVARHDEPFVEHAIENVDK